MIMLAALNYFAIFLRESMYTLGRNLWVEEIPQNFDYLHFILWYYFTIFKSMLSRTVWILNLCGTQKLG